MRCKRLNGTRYTEQKGILGDNARKKPRGRECKGWEWKRVAKGGSGRELQRVGVEEYCKGWV